MIIPFSECSDKLFMTATSNFFGVGSDKIIHATDSLGSIILKLGMAVNDVYASDKAFSVRLNAKDVPGEETAFVISREKEKEYEKILNDAGIIYTTKKEKMTQLAKKIAKALKCGVVALFLLAPGVLLALASAPAFLIRQQTMSARNEIACIRSGVLLDKVLVESEPIKILTCNVALSESDIMNTINGVLKTGTRIPDFIRFFLKEDPDVLCLQEAFSSLLIHDEIAMALKNQGYYVAMGAKLGRAFGLSSGLFLASKYPIRIVGFQPFSNGDGADAMARKGVMGALLDLGNKRYATVFTTHLQGGFVTGDQIKQRALQLGEAKSFMQQFTSDCQQKGYPSEDIFIAGDFNTSRYGQQGLSTVGAEYDYPSLKEFDNLFKELTIPDLGKSFETYFSNRFDPVKAIAEKLPHLELTNESGEAGGTALFPESFSYKYFKELNCPELMVDAGCIDHLFKQQTAGPQIFSERQYSYKVILPYGEVGPLTDHRALFVSVMQNLKPLVIDRTPTPAYIEEKVTSPTTEGWEVLLPDGLESSSP